MVLMHLFAGKEWRHRHREWTWAHSEGGREWDDGKYIYIYTTRYKSDNW